MLQDFASTTLNDRAVAQIDLLDDISEYQIPLGAAALSLEGVFTYWTDSGDLLPAPQIALHWLF